MRSIQERRDEFHIAKATLLGAVFHRDYEYFLYETSSRRGLSRSYLSLADAARGWLHEHGHGLEGWSEQQ